MGFLRAPAQRLFAYAQYDTPSPRGAPRLGRKDMGKMPVPQALKVVWRWVFCGRPLKDSSLTLIVTGGKRLRSKCGRIKISHPITKSEFFVETLWSIATFRVSEEKFQISFWQRFFFLWLRFFLFGRSKKKEMNKTDSYATEYFAYAQYDVLKYRHSANCLALRQRRNGTNRVLKEEARRAHPQGVLIYTAYACI